MLGDIVDVDHDLSISNNDLNDAPSVLHLGEARVEWIPLQSDHVFIQFCELKLHES